MLVKTAICIISGVALMSISSVAVAQNIKYIEIIDSESGLVASTAPFPSTWQRIENPNSDVSFTGPNGVKAYRPTTHKYYFSPNLGIGGQNLEDMQAAAPISIEQYFHELIKPNMEAQGLRLIATYDLPEYVDLAKRSASRFISAQAQSSNYVIGSDWVRQDGTKTMLVSRGSYIENGKSNVVFWSITMSHIDAPPAEFEQAKKVIRYAIANTKFSQENTDYYERKNRDFQVRNDAYWEQRTRNLLIQHQGRMRDLAAIGEQSRQIGRDNLQRLEDNHRDWQNKEAGRWDNHADAVRAIHGRTVIGNPNSSGGYEVEGGYDNYWVNENGDYIPSNDGFYDPNQDGSVNSDYWTQSEERR